MPKVYSGVEQYPAARACRCATASTHADAPTQKKRQYYAMLGTRGIWEDGWKAVAVHAPITGKGHFDKDVWELYHVDVDRSESKNLAKENPEKLKALIKAWFEEAEQEPRAAARRSHRARAAQHRAPVRRSRHVTRYIYSPGTSPVPEGVAVNIRGRSYKILANVEITDPNCSGVIFAHGSRFGGHSLFIKDKKLYYVYNFLGIPPEQQFVSKRAEAREVHARHGVHREKGRRVPRIPRHDQALRGRQGRGRGADAAQVGQVHAVRAMACASGATAGTPVSKEYKIQNSRSPVARSWASPSPSPPMSTSTWRSRRRRPWPATRRSSKVGRAPGGRVKPPVFTYSALTKPIGSIPPGVILALSRMITICCHPACRNWAARRRSPLEYPFDARPSADSDEETLSEYICDWPGCPNVAEHVFGMIVELRQFVAVCSEHARLASAAKTHQSGG